MWTGHGIGHGQTWKTVPKAVGAIYTNTSGRTILAYPTATVSGSNYVQMTFYVNGVVVASWQSGGPYATALGSPIPIPPGANYMATISGGGYLAWWAELS